jgi:hypothetical protein
MPVKYRQVIDGEWYEASWIGQRDMCCSCGLVHITDFKVEKGKLYFKTKQSARATKDARKRFKFKKEE